MKTAAIILMSIVLVVFIKNSRAGDPGEVFEKLATGKDAAGQPAIPEGGLPPYLDKNGWTRTRGGLTREQAEAVIAGEDKVITKGKWNAIMQTGMWLAKHNPDRLWTVYSGYYTEKIPKETLAEFMRQNGFTGSMTAEDAAATIADADGQISKAKWNAMIETAKCVRDAK